MHCQEFDACLADFIEGTVEPEKKRALEEHAAACPNCRSLLARYRDLVRNLHTLPAAECPQTVIERTMANLSAEVRAHGNNARGKAQGNIWKYAVRGAAAVLVAGLIYFSARNDFGNRQEEFTEAEVAAARKQVELTLGYLHHYGALTENILKEEVFTRSIRKPIEASIKKTIGQF